MKHAFSNATESQRLLVGGRTRDGNIFVEQLLYHVRVTGESEMRTIAVFHGSLTLIDKKTFRTVVGEK